MKAYKLFRTLKSKPGQLFPLFIGKTKATPIGQWIDAEFIPTKGYAHRPGWHAGTMPIAPHLRGKNDRIQEGRVWCEVEVSDDINYQQYADESPTRDLRDRLPINGYYRFKTNKIQGGAWIIAGAIRVTRIMSNEQVTQVLQDNGYTQEEIEGEMR